MHSPAQAPCVAGGADRSSLSAGPAELLEDAASRTKATVARAANARRRAQEALARAEEAERRVLALKGRQGPAEPAS